MQKQRLAIVITRGGPRQGVIDAPWLGIGFRVDASDWVVLSDEGWRAVVEGDPIIWHALERKLLIGFYATQPELVAVVGHPGGRKGDDAEAEGREEVARVVRRVRSLLLPATVRGFWTDEEGLLEDVVELDDASEGHTRRGFFEDHELQAGGGCR
jgi:hypothetical protein